jgi:hypothetical protein
MCLTCDNTNGQNTEANSKSTVTCLSGGRHCHAGCDRGGDEGDAELRGHFSLHPQNLFIYPVSLGCSFMPRLLR